MIRIKKNGMSDLELRDQLTLIVKALTASPRNDVFDSCADVVPQAASKKMVKDAKKHFDDMLAGIQSDVLTILKRADGNHV